MVHRLEDVGQVSGRIGWRRPRPRVQINRYRCRTPTSAPTRQPASNDLRGRGRRHRTRTSPPRAVYICLGSYIRLGAYSPVVSVSTTIEVIAEPSRLHILEELRSGEQPVCALVERLAISQPAVSKHLRVLRDAGLVGVRPDGQRRLYSLRPAPLIELDNWLEPYRQMWRNSLDRFEEHLAESQTSRRKRS